MFHQSEEELDAGLHHLQGILHSGQDGMTPQMGIAKGLPISQKQRLSNFVLVAQSYFFPLFDTSLILIFSGIRLAGS